ncbi:2-succinyl-5-enolpyruvyl-6-hydroxy-3-cyclohexene-1-carboxylic-acid synthase [Yimella sp. cx-51]|nr:2-succinyl-5-enolpyruvyl-6-hydroxy-3-cyclohexene-1-carboxylic-acid synthase [Yimella sp. cx-51]QTH39476.1 2-succinyl-5-enolpyruvyl-6-hydroxy-3-cyclohexene-1-carboxylic-acid synthase [Yimella sp. cx-51]
MALATVLVDELIRHGVRDIVLAPGSRSAPLAYAALEAERAGRLRLHVRIDERSAAFLALGMAKVRRVPVPVITTSGTAVANLHPAVLEAHHAAVPMLILSADRPPEMRSVGANQTTDQVKIFGDATRWFYEFAAPERRPDQNAWWRSIVGRALAEATGVPAGDAGPVHLNIPFRAPLVPTEGHEEWPEDLSGRPRGESWLNIRQVESHRPSAVPGPGIAPIPRTLVILGDVPEPSMAAQVAELADSAGWPVIAEPFGKYHRGRVTPHGALILRATDWLERNLPERVLIAGRTTLDRHVAALLKHPDVTVEVITSGTSWAGASHRTRRVHPWEAIERSRTAVSSCADRAWTAHWRKAGTALSEAATPVVESSWPSGMAVARTVVHNMPEGSALVVGPSNIARDLDLARNANRISRDVVSVSNRGLAGIDGVVSTAIGVGLTHPDHHTYALMGDLTFLHDGNALLIGADNERPDLTVVVVNDDGGGIFSTLEPGQERLSDSFERIFGTPTGANLELVCAARGADYELIADADALADRIANPGRGIRVLEVKVERAAERGLHELLAQTAREALAPLE